jgi:hypothetical protein
MKYWGYRCAIWYGNTSKTYLNMRCETFSVSNYQYDDSAKLEVVTDTFNAHRICT